MLSHGRCDVGWAKPAARANARPMINSASPPPCASAYCGGHGASTPFCPSYHSGRRRIPTFETLPASSGPFLAFRQFRAELPRHACNMPKSERPVRQHWSSSSELFPDWRVEGDFNLADIVPIQPMNFDDGARRIGTSAPQLLLDLVHDRTEAIHVRDIDDEADRITQRRSFGFGNHLHIEESLTNASLVTLDLQVRFRIDTAHSGDEDEIARARAKTPCARRLDRTVRRKRLHPARRERKRLGRCRMNPQQRDNQWHYLLQGRPPVLSTSPATMACAFRRTPSAPPWRLRSSPAMRSGSRCKRCFHRTTSRRSRA